MMTASRLIGVRARAMDLSTTRPKKPVPVTGHTFKKGTAAHTALLKSAGLAPATQEKPVTKKPVVTDQKRPYKK